MLLNENVASTIFDYIVMHNSDNTRSDIALRVNDDILVSLGSIDVFRLVIKRYINKYIEEHIAWKHKPDQINMHNEDFISFIYRVPGTSRCVRFSYFDKDIDEFGVDINDSTGYWITLIDDFGWLINGAVNGVKIKGEYPNFNHKKWDIDYKNHINALGHDPSFSK